ncbi:hypothetical protein C2E23DRAFT_735705 [Lenzites betulinus]|nr:hypothetical protein C2E23DRAFT_735705 [Lenzites betulinus]
MQAGLSSAPGEYRGRGRGWGNDNRGSRGRGRFPRVDGQPECEYPSNRPWQTRAVEELPPPRDIMEGLLVPASQQLMLPDVTSPDKPISLRTFACVGSYTWRKDRNPTIVVPGYPPRWRERPLPIQVRFDNGIRMIHENKYYMGGASSFIPLFHAVDATTDENAEQSASALDVPVQEVGVPAKVHWPSVDFVTDRNNLRKFLRWIRLCTAETASTDGAASSSAREEATLDADDSAGSHSLPDTVSSTPPSTSPPDPQWDPRQDFRIDLILGGEKTVLMERWAPLDRERVVPPKGGCRDNFVREAMVHGPECENGGGHYRIVQYDIGGLRMVVRWEVDSWISDLDALAPATSPTTEFESAPTTPSDPAPPAVASWGVPTNDNASWDVPANDSASWDVPTTDNASWDVPTTDNASWDVPTTDNASWDVPTTDNASWDVPTNDNASWDVPANDGATSDAGRSAGADTLAPKQDLKVIRAGTLLPQSMMLELATRSKMFLDRTNAEDTFLQLFLTQSPVNIVAVHSRGLFDRIILQELASPELANFNECADIQRSLAQLVALLREIQGIVQEHGQAGRLSLVCEKGQLRVYNRVAGDDDPVLARDLARFEVKAEQCT